jgi:hypothetical protein
MKLEIMTYSLHCTEHNEHNVQTSVSQKLFISETLQELCVCLLDVLRILTISQIAKMYRKSILTTWYSSIYLKIIT